MAASERLSLLLEARTSGEQDLARLERQVNQVIAAAEKTSKTAGFDGVEKSANRATESAQSLGNALRDFVSDPLGSANNALLDFTRGMGSFGGIVAAGSAVAVAAGTAMFSLAKSFDDAGEAAINMSERTGLTYKEVGLFTKAAELAGVSAEGLTTSIKGMSRVLLDTGQEGEQLRKTLSGLGANFKNDFGGVKSTKDLFLEIAKALQGIEDPALRADTAIKALGKPGLELLPLLRSNLSETLTELDRFGVGLSDVQVKKADEYGAALDRLSVQLSVLRKRLSEFSADSLKGPVQILGFLASVANGNPDPKALGLNTSRIPKNFGDAPIALPPGEAADGSASSLSAADLSIARARGIAQAPSLADLEATLTQSRRNQIKSFLAGRRSVEEEISALESQLKAQESDGDFQGVQDTVVQIAAARARKIAQEKAKELQKRLDGFTTDFAKAIFEPGGNLKPLQRARAVQPYEIAALEEFQAFNSPVDINSIPAGTRSVLPTTGLGSFAREGLNDVQSQQVSAVRQELEYQRDKIELLTGPGGEIAAIQQIARLKLDVLEQEMALGADAFDIEQQRRQVAIDTELQILSIRRNALNVGKDQLFGLATGQTTPGQFASNTALTIGRNAFGRVYDGVIGPALGKFGAASGLGDLLSGTAFDPAQRVGMDGNTRATDENTAALRTLTSTIGGGGILSGGGTAGIPSIFGGGASRGGLGSIFSLLGFGKKSNSTTAYTETGGEGDELASLQSVGGNGRAIRGVGIAAAGIGGAFGVYSGIRTGGARGATAAIGSGAGATAAILSLAGVAGPAAPILAGIALGAEVIRSMLPDPKVSRDRRINSTLDAAVYSGPMSGAYSEDIYGRGSYYNKRGEMQVTIYQNVQAWDSSSFIDHRQDIADATRQAMQEAHPINFEIQQLSTAY